MHNHANRFEVLEPGLELGPLAVTITDEANQRFWHAAGIDHPAAAAGVLYPPIGAQFAIMLTRAAVAPGEVLHAAQTLRSHGLAFVGHQLVTTGVVRDRYEKRDRPYVAIETKTVDAATGALVWTGLGTFVPVLP